MTCPEQKHRPQAKVVLESSRCLARCQTNGKKSMLGAGLVKQSQHRNASGDDTSLLSFGALDWRASFLRYRQMNGHCQ